MTVDGLYVSKVVLPRFDDGKSSFQWQPAREYHLVVCHHDPRSWCTPTPSNAVLRLADGWTAAGPTVTRALSTINTTGADAQAAGSGDARYSVGFIVNGAPARANTEADPPSVTIDRLWHSLRHRRD